MPRIRMMNRIALLLVLLAVLVVLGLRVLGAGERSEAPLAGDAELSDASKASTATLQESDVADGASRTAAATVDDAAVEPTGTAEPAISLTGRVETPDGEPATGATVVLGGVGSLKFLVAGDEPKEEHVHTQTDEEGRFHFDDPASSLFGGRLLVTAGALDSAPSETAILDLAEHSDENELVLRLRHGARIHGEVHRSDGVLPQGRPIRFMQDEKSVDAQGNRLLFHAETDELGRFDERHLAPGVWGLVTYPDDEELDEIGGDMFEHMVQKTVAVGDGEEVFVALGARSPDAVTVTGLVTLDGEPVKGLLQWIQECEDPTGSTRNPKVGIDGRYEVELQSHGAWYVRFMGGPGHVEKRVDIPKGPTFELDFELPTGRIMGRLVDENGDAVAGAMVSHVLIEGGEHHHPMRVGDDRDTSEEDGSFELDGIVAGAYRIGATHETAGVAASELVRVRQGEQLEGLELVVRSGRSLRGRISSADGLPMRGAPVWIHGSDGRLVNPITSVRSDREGTFTTPSLPPGTYTLFTRRALACAIVRDIVIEANDLDPDRERVPLELDLREGAVVLVRALKGGEPTQSQVRAFDRDGLLFTGLRHMYDPWEWRRLPFDSESRHIGPLPPGTYVLDALVPGVGSASREMALAPGERRELDLAVD